MSAADADSAALLGMRAGAALRLGGGARACSTDDGTHGVRGR